MIHVAGPTFKEFSERYPDANFVGARTNFSPDQFAKMVAKIGYCGAVCALGPRAFTNTPIRGIILGSDLAIGRWVGSWWGPPVNEPFGGLHGIKVLCNLNGPEIHVIVRLFAQFGAPEYHVVLGEPDPAFVASPEWPDMWRTRERVDLA